MRHLFLLVACVLASGGALAAKTITYNVAHTRHQDTNMVVVVTDSQFFSRDHRSQELGYTSLQSCVRSVNMAGTVILVANVNGGFRYYGPKSWHRFLSTIDMAWVRPRINKKMTCNF